MSWYGFDHRYGAQMRDGNGDLIGKLVVFPSRSSLNKWIAAGNADQHGAGARTAVKSRYAAKFMRLCTNVEYLADDSH